MADGGVDIVRGGAELLDAVGPLWLAMRDHHQQVAPHLGPVRGDDDSWARRRRQYEEWLAGGDAFVLLARRDGAALGYAFVRGERGGSPTWVGPERRLDLESLSVGPRARGTGVGGALLDAVRAAAEREDAVIELTAVADNADALRFYARAGFVPTFTVLRDSRRRP